MLTWAVAVAVVVVIVVIGRRTASTPWKVLRILPPCIFRNLTHLDLQRLLGLRLKTFRFARL